jgi:hypothetical protein
MSFPCATCQKSFTTKASLERHERTDKHAKCLACVAPSQTKITDFFVLEAKIKEQDEVIAQLSAKVLVLETTTAALQVQTASLTEQVTALVRANVQLAHDNEVAALKLELAKAQTVAPVPSPAPAAAPTTVAPELMALLQAQTAAIQAIQTKVNKPRHTGEENNQILIEKWFKHPRKYPHLPPPSKKGEDPNDYKSGFIDLCTKLQDKFKECPDLDRADYEERLFSILKEEVIDKTENGNSYINSHVALIALHRWFKFSDKYNQIMADWDAEMATGMAQRVRGEP